MKRGLEELITEGALLALAGERAFARGAAYFEAGAVADLVDTGKAIKACVVGTDEYQVRLWPGRGALDYSCTCPVGEDGDFCKHAVATGLAWLAQRADEAGAPASSTARGRHDALRAYLAGRSKDELVALVLEQAEEDPALRSRLETEAAGRASTDDPAAVREAIRRALAVHGGVDFYGMRRYIERAAPVLDLLSGLLRRGDASAVFDAAEYAVRQGLSAYEKVDDSSGSFGDMLSQMAELHLKAGRKAKPDGEALANSLFELLMRDDWGLFRFEDYAPLLGKAGVARFRKLAEAAWAKVPPLKPGDRRDLGEEGRHMLTRIMEALARREGDVDRLIEVKSRDLSRSHAFLEIAQILEKAGRRDEALAWAERGHAAFKEELHVPLAEFLIAAYHRPKRHDDALALAWDQFSRWPGLSAYQQLKKSADRTKAWPEWREQALGHLRAALKAANGNHSHWNWTAGGHSLFVEIFLWEGDSDAALAEAKAGGCTEDLWFKLAKAREKQHPQDAIEIYRARVEPIVNQKDNRAYDEATELIGKIGALMKRVGQQREFTAWLDAMRVKHKAKRNFMQRLDRVFAKSGGQQDVE
ncbi:MAG: SWIM zinc finger family protein [Betaproteobacteria bacterium]|nr:SWIM zinc finger family protein [Betaproteobacteria bacterium]